MNTLKAIVLTLAGIFTFTPSASATKLVCRLGGMNDAAKKIVLLTLDESRSQITWQGQGTFPAEFNEATVHWKTPYPDPGNTSIIGYAQQLDRASGELSVSWIGRDGGHRPMFSGPCTLAAQEKRKF